MTQRNPFLAAILAAAAVVASCGAQPTGDNRAMAATVPAERAFAVEQRGTFDEPWAMAFEPGTGNLFITEKRGTIRFLQPDGSIGTVSGVPRVDYGGQGGLGDFVFAPDYAASRLVYLSWAEAGIHGTRGAAVGRAKLVCQERASCQLHALSVIWRQVPKVDGRGHYSQRIAFSPDGQYLFIASGERQKMEPAQDSSNTLGKIVRLLPDGTPAPGNPLAGRDLPSREVWSLGHRNILGLRFDSQGRLWDLEHGPAGGDELNLVEPGKNYGWPVVSNGDHYSGEAIPRHPTHPEFTAPAISWNPVIAPGDFIFYSGGLFPEWRGQALITGLKSEALIRVAIDGRKATELARHDFGARLRAIAQGPDGAIWVAEDGPQARLLKLTPRK